MIKNKKQLAILTLILFLAIANFNNILSPLKAAIGINNWVSDSSISDTYTSPSMAIDTTSLIPTNDGGLIAVWNEWATGANIDDILIQKFNSAGVKQWDGAGINVTNLGIVSAASYSGGVVDTDGNTYIAWYNGDGVGNAEVFVQKIDPDGNLLWGSEGSGVAVSSEINQQQSPTIALDGAGGVFVGFNDGSTPYKTRVQRISAAGNLLWTAGGLRITTLSTREEWQHLMIPATSNSVIILSTDTPVVPANGGIYIQKLDGNGNKLFGANGIKIGNAQSNINENINLLAQGTGFIAAWQDSNTNSIFVQKLNSSGTAQWTANGVAITNDSTNIDQTIAATSAEIIVSWYGSDGNLYANKIDTDGDILWTDTMVADADSYGRITSDGNGGFYALVDNYNALPIEITAYKFNSSGVQEWSKVLSDGITDNYIAGIETSSTNRLFASWITCDNADCDNYDEILLNAYTPAYQIDNLASNLDVQDSLGSDIEVGDSDGVTGSSVSLKLIDADNGLLISEVDVDMSSDRDWSSVTGDSDPINGKAVVANITSAPGAESTHTLYIPQLPGTNAVYICPDANVLADIDEDCTNGYLETSPTVVTINSEDYYEIPALTGTGGIGITTASNTAPNFTIISVTPSINEGSAVTLSVTFSDPNGSDTHELTVNWGDGLSNAYNLIAGDLSESVTHTYANNPVTNPYTISLTIEDSTLNDSDSTTTIVNNVAPTLNSIETTGSGLTKTINGNIVEPGSLDTMTLLVDWGDGSADTSTNLAAESTAFSNNHIYAAGSYTITLTITDASGGTNTYTKLVTVTAPAVSTSAAEAIVSAVPATPVIGNIVTTSPLKNSESEDSTPFFDWTLEIDPDIVQYQVYLMMIANENGTAITGLPENFEVPKYLLGVATKTTSDLSTLQALAPGTYKWQVVAVDASGSVVSRSTVSQFKIKTAIKINEPIDIPVSDQFEESVISEEKKSGNNILGIALPLAAVIGFIFFVFYKRRKSKE